MPVTAVRDEGAFRMWVCRLPVHIGPLGSCIFVADSHKNRSGFSGRFKGAPGGESKSPRARFLFAAFSFGEAKEKVGRQPQISNMRFVLLYVWLVVCVKGMRNLLSSLYYRDSLFVNYHSSLRLSSPLDRFGRM